jgi:hypothetical protein
LLLQEAKEIRKTKLAKSQADESNLFNQSAENLQPKPESQLNQSIDCVQYTDNTQSSSNTSEQVHHVTYQEGSTPLNSREMTTGRQEKLLAFTGLFSKSMKCVTFNTLLKILSGEIFAVILDTMNSQSLSFVHLNITFIIKSLKLN